MKLSVPIGLLLISLATLSGFVAAMNFVIDAGAENVMQQVVYSIRFYGATLAMCVLLVGGCVCLSVGR